MRVAFDLDNTLIRSAHPFALETPRLGWLARLLGHEQLRRGTKALMRHCQQQGWEVWVYTTSYRSSGYIRRLFGLHGIRLAGVVNQTRHERTVTARCSKHPPTFGIDVLVDDSEGVRLEGERHGFRVLVVRPEDEEWVETVQRKLLQPV
ncbi:hypothetical protein LJ737_08500 [Hymenobacter sp. 15J16-1T3B]|uniref:hypothetical protein n=1 Tax=Hymenobacter sp. 15J16-1T3B TaxID=2886941 RepID=UPI001D126579|nr:hypothetical protein [Hymenobacter sp. 15J16-1T3B]MCC3157276.1 hypothetical protein [Hymenobacter sp. 15J16-1T3B]